MNCLECSEQLQRILDGETAPGAYDAHLAACKSCHDQHLLARALLQGLNQLTPPAPPDYLGRHLVHGVLQDRVRRRRRRWLVGTAAAAAVLLAFLAVLNQPRHGLEKVDLLVKLGGPKQPSLEDNVQEAGQALADLTRRTANDTLESSRTFLPNVDFNGPADPGSTVPELPSEPRRAWNDALGGVSAGLEPLAASARQAASFFRREVPLLGQDPGSGL